MKKSLQVMFCVMKCTSGYYLRKPSFVAKCPRGLVEVIALCFWAQQFTLSQCSTQVYGYKCAGTLQ